MLSTEDTATTVRIAAHVAAAARLITPARSLIGDTWVDSASGSSIDHVNPTTGRIQGHVLSAGTDEIDAAVRSARGAFDAWASTPAGTRATLLRRIADRIRMEADELGVLGALETGIPRTGMVGGAMLAAEYFDYYSGWADKITGEVVSTPAAAFNYTLPEPYGVIAAIVNWNGPMTAIGRKVAPALAAGNCVVVKSPELAPFAVERFARICLEVGLPPGVVTVLAGGAATGDGLVRHLGVDKVSFTGSGATARKVLAAAATQLTPATLELGGKSPNIIFADADLEKASAMATTAGVVKNAGQGCLLPTRLLVQESVYDEVVERVLGTLATVRVGDPLTEEVDMGPVIDGRSCDRIQGVIDGARDQGLGLLAGGGRLGGGYADGFFLEPTVFGPVSNDSDLARREIFGPVLSVIRFRDDAEALALANDSEYGLAAYVHTRDLTRAHTFATKLRAGYLSVNGMNPMAPTAPFGGRGESGYGTEGGEAGLQEFLRPKSVYVALG